MMLCSRKPPRTCPLTNVFTISIITRYEILRGLKAKGALKQATRFEDFCSRNQVLPIDDKVIVQAADIYADLYNRAIENYFSIRALREVFGSQIPEAVTEILPNEKLEKQIGMNVKANNRAIAREMTIEEIADTDFNSFLERVDAILRS